MNKEDVSRFLATFPSRPVESPSTRLTSVHFSIKSAVYRSDGYLHGRWEASFDSACRAVYPNFLQEASVVRIQELGACSSGEIILMCEHY